VNEDEADTKREIVYDPTSIGYLIKFIETQSRWSCWSWERDNGTVSVWDDDRVLEWTVVMVNVLTTTGPTLKNG
jgi:hypothetical protein